MKKCFFLLSVLLIAALSLTGCRVGSEALAEAVSIKVTATQDFGRELIFDREAVIETRLSAQDVLAKVTDFETDGSYILEFEGLRGDDQVYWMYYINGLLSKYFAGGYIIRPGDVMLWDFHPWAGAHHGSSAIIGSFPEPMLHGYEGQTCPTTVVYGDGYRDAAREITDGLRELGVTDISATAWDELTENEKRENNILIIADSENPLIADLNDHADPLGMYAYFDRGGVVVTNYKFEAAESYGAGTGVFQACQNLWNPLGTGACQNAVFMVSGNDAAGVDRAAELVLDSIEAIRNGESSAIDYAYGVIIDADGTVVRTPL